MEYLFVVQYLREMVLVLVLLILLLGSIGIGHAIFKKMVLVLVMFFFDGVLILQIPFPVLFKPWNRLFYKLLIRLTGSVVFNVPSKFCLCIRVHTS